MKDFGKTAWEWKEVKPLPVKSQPRIFNALKLLVPFVLAGLLYFWGRLTLASIAAGIGLLLLLLKFVVPFFHETILRFFNAVGRWLAKSISYTILSLLYGLLFTPVALISRLLRRDPLELKWLASQRTFWSGIPNVDSRKLFSKPFLAERRNVSEHRTMKKVLRISRAVYATALLLFLLNLGGGLIYNKIRAAIKAAKLDWRSELSVYEDSNWAQDYFKELHGQPLQSTFIYKPFVEWGRKDFSGRYINIDGGHRKTYQPHANSRPLLKVYAFGASTMWGWGARDNYTIASLLAKRAEQDNIHLQVTNCAEPGYVNWQNVIYLAELCAEGKIPDLVLFYEGAGDVITKLHNPTMNRVHMFYSDRKKRIENRYRISEWLKENSLAHIVGRRLSQNLNESENGETKNTTEPEKVREFAREIVDTYRQNSGFVQKLADSYGFEVLFFWQPTLSTKANRSNEERDFRIPFGDLMADVYSAASEEIRTQGFAIDLSKAFDEQRQTLYIDWAHVSEQGNEIIANKLYHHIEPALQALNRSEQIGYNEYSRN